MSILPMSLYSLIKGPLLRQTGESGYGYATTADEVTEHLDLSGKTVLVTGANSGLGFATVRAIARRGARVLALARTLDKAREAAARACGELSPPPAAQTIVPIACELSDPASVRDCVQKVAALGWSLDALICNAGIMALPKLQQRFGIELQFFTNHLGHYMLVTALLHQLSDAGRVVLVSSEAHKGAPRAGIEFDNLSGEVRYRPWAAYGQSKLANLLFARWLAHRLRGEGSARTANALHPGVIRTNLVRHMPLAARLAFGAAAPLVLKDARQGAATQCYLAVHPHVEGVSGEYFADCNRASPSRQGRDMALAERLWHVSEEIVGRL